MGYPSGAACHGMLISRRLIMPRSTSLPGRAAPLKTLVEKMGGADDGLDATCDHAACILIRRRPEADTFHRNTLAPAVDYALQIGKERMTRTRTHIYIATQTAYPDVYRDGLPGARKNSEDNVVCGL